MTWREPAVGSLANPATPLPPWPERPVGTRAEHGTEARYRYRRDPCRCEPCKQAHREAQRAARAQRKARHA